MSLKIYDRLTDIPKNVTYISNPGLFFDGRGVVLSNTEEVRQLIKSVDGATFIGGHHVRYSPDAEPESTDTMSMGVKILLSVLCRPDLCFNVNTCGDDSINRLIHFKEGHVYLAFPFIVFNDLDHDDCDVIWRGERFTNVFDYLERVSEVLKEEE